MSATRWSDTTGQRPSDAGYEGRSYADRSVAEQLSAVEPMVRAICRSRLGAADGDDAAQRTMLTLWRRLEAVGTGDRQRIESLPGYAAVCARYEVLASLSEFGRRPTVAIGEAAERACVDDGAGPEAQTLRAAETAEAAARVEQLLAALSPREIEVMRATKLADTEPDTTTAAQALGITPSSVRTVQARAMARLRELCGTRSPNPLASSVPLAERRKASWSAYSARDAEQMAHPSPAQTAFADDFRQRRLDRGLSQSQLGTTLGCDGSYVSKVERGKTWPSREFAGRLDEAFDAGGAMQRCHDRHAASTSCGGAVDRECGDRSDAEGADDLRADLTRDGLTTDEPASSAEAACAMAHAAVQAAVQHDQADECGAGHETGDHNEEARAAQLAQWHDDDQQAALSDRVDGADHEWAWSA